MLTLPKFNDEIKLTHDVTYVFKNISWWRGSVERKILERFGYTDYKNLPPQLEITFPVGTIFNLQKFKIDVRRGIDNNEVVLALRKGNCPEPTLAATKYEFSYLEYLDFMNKVK